MRASKMWSIVAGQQKVTISNWEHHRSWSSYNYMKNCQKPNIKHLKQIGEVKNSMCGCLMSWLKILKIVLKCHFSLTLTTTTTVSPSHCDVWQKMDLMWQLVTISSVIGPRSSSKALPRAKPAPKNGHGPCLVVCWWSDPLQFSESQWNHYIWEVCSANRWDAPKTAMPAAGTGQAKGPNSSPQQCLTNAAKAEWIGLRSFASSVILALLPTDYNFFKHLENFLEGKRFHNQQEAENAFQKFVESWSTHFYASGINQLISLWQKCADCNGSYFD